MKQAQTRREVDDKMREDALFYAKHPDCLLPWWQGPEKMCQGYHCCNTFTWDGRKPSEYCSKCREKNENPI